MNKKFYQAAYFLECLKQSGQLEDIKAMVAGDQQEDCSHPSSWKLAVAKVIHNHMRKDPYHRWDINIGINNEDHDIRVTLDNVISRDWLDSYGQLTAEITDDCRLSLSTITPVQGNYPFRLFALDRIEHIPLKNPNAFLRTVQHELFDHFACTVDYAIETLESITDSPIFPQSLRDAYRVLKRQSVDALPDTSEVRKSVGAALMLCDFLKSPHFRESNLCKQMKFASSLPEHNEGFNFEIRTPRLKMVAKDAQIKMQPTKYAQTVAYMPGDESVIRRPSKKTSLMPDYSFAFDNTPKERIAALVSLGITLDEQDKVDLRYIDDLAQGWVGVNYAILNQHPDHIATNTLLNIPIQCDEHGYDFVKAWEKRASAVPPIALVIFQRLAEGNEFLKDGMSRYQSEQLAEALGEISSLEPDYCDDLQPMTSPTSNLTL